MRIRNLIINVICFVAVLVCSTWMLASSDDAPPQFSDWSAAVNLGPIVNSSVSDQAPIISPDGLSLYFSSQRPGGIGGVDIYVSQRASVLDPWGVLRRISTSTSTTSTHSSLMVVRPFPTTGTGCISRATVLEDLAATTYTSRGATTSGMTSVGSRRKTSALASIAPPPRLNQNILRMTKPEPSRFTFDRTGWKDPAAATSLPARCSQTKPSAPPFW